MEQQEAKAYQAPDSTMPEHKWHEAMEAQLKTAEADVSADMGEDAWDSGGWADVSRSLIEMADGPDEWKRDALQYIGLERRLSFRGEAPGSLEREEDSWYA